MLTDDCHCSKTWPTTRRSSSTARWAAGGQRPVCVCRYGTSRPCKLHVLDAWASSAGPAAEGNGMPSLVNTPPAEWGGRSSGEKWGGGDASVDAGLRPLSRRVRTACRDGGRNVAQVGDAEREPAAQRRDSGAAAPAAHAQQPAGLAPGLVLLPHQRCEWPPFCPLSIIINNACCAFAFNSFSLPQWHMEQHGELSAAFVLRGAISLLTRSTQHCACRHPAVSAGGVDGRYGASGHVPERPLHQGCRMHQNEALPAPCDLCLFF
jgi:hypothetical protein